MLSALIALSLLLGQDYRIPVPPVEDTPGLPRVLLIGDSISIGYGLPVRKLLAGKANVHRIPANGGTSANGIFMVDTWLSKETGNDKWDVIHFNFGLHDLKRLEDGQQQVTLDAYRRYLTLFAKRLKKTNAKLIYATTTPVPEGKVSPPRLPADVIAYNNVAVEIMKQLDIPINDLYSFALPKLKDIQLPVNVHFTNDGSEQLARQVAAKITPLLQSK